MNSLFAQMQETMHSLSFFAQYYIFAVMVIIPMWRIYRRAGFPAVQSLTLVIPVVGLVVAVLGLALRPWPNLPPSQKRKKKEYLS